MVYNWSIELVKRKMEKVPFTVKFDSQKLERVRKVASSEDRSVSSLINHAVTQYLQKSEKK
jgi:predicted transcriptional regulator